MSIQESPLWRAVLTAISLWALIGCATNKTSGTSARGFDQADANHDGKVSRVEMSNYIVSQVFNSRDANHDGRMTQEEWSGGDSARLAQFKKRDANGDGLVTKEEAIDYSRQHGITDQIFREADKNHDDTLDRSEFDAYYAAREGPPQ
jgi:Ca2+-binding EF-hand superfamily protein